jgi:hypothetical protein
VLTTVVPWWLIALLFLTVLACVVITALTFYLRSQVRRDKKCELVEHSPIDLWTWMAQAVAESSTDRDGALVAVNPKQLRRWYIVVSDHSGARIEKRADELQPLTGSSASNGNQEENYGH